MSPPSSTGTPASDIVFLACSFEPIASIAAELGYGDPRDFRRAYTIAERADLRILRDPFSAKPHVLFYATKRVGGNVVDPRAYKVLNFSA